MVEKWLALLPHSKKVLHLVPSWDRAFYVEFTCSPHVCVGFLRVLRFRPSLKHAH